MLDACSHGLSLGSNVQPCGFLHGDAVEIGADGVSAESFVSTCTLLESCRKSHTEAHMVTGSFCSLGGHQVGRNRCPRSNVKGEQLVDGDNKPRRSWLWEGLRTEEPDTAFDIVA